MKLIIYLFLLFVPAVVFSQELYSIHGKIEGYENRKISLTIFNGNRTRVADSVRTDGSGSFIIPLKLKDYIGLYRLKLDNGKKADLIFNNESINFSTKLDDLTGSMKIAGSKENSVFYDYLDKKIKTDEKLNLLNPLILNYPKNDPFYKKVRKQFTEIQKKQLKYALKLIDENDKRWVTNIIRFQLMPVLDPELDEVQQAAYLKAHYFDYVTFTDSTLLNSDLLPTKILSFLSLFMNRENSPGQQAKEFENAIDLLMPKIKDSKKLYTFVFEYLMDGFEQIGMDKVMAYLVDNYEPDKVCMAEYGTDNLEKRIESFKKLSAGKKAPDIQFRDINGNSMKLSEIKSDYVLLVFWFTDCPHCRHLVPIINSIYKNRKPGSYEVVAVSIDTSLSAWQSFVKSNNLEFINSCDGLGWDSNPVKIYSIYATPSIFLIDSNGLIAGKPADEKELRKLLKEKGL